MQKWGLNQVTKRIPEFKKQNDVYVKFIDTQYGTRC